MNNISKVPKVRYFLKLFVVILFSVSGSFNNLKAQGTFNTFRQLTSIQDFYTKYSQSYSNDFFNSHVIGHSLNTFSGAQILGTGAWSLELRAGMSAHLPARYYDEPFGALDSFKQIQSFNGKPTNTRAAEIPIAYPLQLLFTLNDSNQLPCNTLKNGKDSVQWFIPTFDDLGINKSVAPTYNFILHWAPGYAFEFAGTFEKYASSGTEDKGFTTGKATRYYNIYFAHDVLYWIQSIHSYGWHLTPSIELSDYSIGVSLNTKTASMFQDFQTNSGKVWFKNNLNRIDYLCRTMRYGINFGRSFHRLEVWGGASYIFSRSGMSNDGFVSAFIDEKPNDATNGFRSKRYREFFVTGTTESRLGVFSAGASFGQSRFRFGCQYNILTNGYHHASVSVKVVFRDNNVHPWQKGVVTEEYFDPEKRKTVRKTVIMERDEED